MQILSNNCTHTSQQCMKCTDTIVALLDVVAISFMASFGGLNVPPLPNACSSAQRLNSTAVPEVPWAAVTVSCCHLVLHRR